MFPNQGIWTRYHLTCRSWRKWETKSISHASRFAELMNGSETLTLTSLTHLILTSKNRLNVISPTDENQVVILEGELKSQQYCKKDAWTDLRSSGKLICEEVLALQMKSVMIKYSKMRKANFTKSLFIQRTFFLSMCLLRDHRFHSRHPHERKMAVITVQGRYMYMSDGYSSPLTSSVYHAHSRKGTPSVSPKRILPPNSKRNGEDYNIG